MKKLFVLLMAISIVLSSCLMNINTDYEEKPEEDNPIETPENPPTTDPAPGEDPAPVPDPGPTPEPEPENKDFLSGTEAKVGLFTFFCGIEV